MPQTVWSESAKVALDRRILAKNPETGEPIESPDEMLHRVADNIAGAELSQEKRRYYAEHFYNIMASLEFLPNSPALVNAGRNLQQLAACFVLPVEDSIEGIFSSVKLAARIHQTGGGTGFSFSKLRPEGSRVKTTGNVASGPISFMKVFDAATEAIKQGGVRRGANMGVLSVDHPDIRKFIHLKNDNQTLKNFNVSVAVTHEFMKHLDADTPFPLTFGGKTYEKVSPYTLWKEISESAWTSGDPGVLFMDRINEFNPVPHLGRISATNPCGEVPLLPYHTCNLGSINLAKFVQDGRVKWTRLAHVIEIATRFLDDIIDQNQYPHPSIDTATKQARKIGLGVMGWADMLVQLKIPYGSDESLKLARDVMAYIQKGANYVSAQLGEEKGMFPAWQGSVYSSNIESTPYFRNATRTVIAPTGTLSILADCTSGIEPMFEVAFTKNVMDTQITHYSHSALELIKEVGEESAKNILLTAHEVSVADHVRMQAAFQEFTDDSISKTINFHNNATSSHIMDAYQQAYNLGCKGITVFRDGCKGGEQVLQSGIIGAVDRCSDCNVPLVHSEGCATCPQCGVSLCSA